MSYVLGGWAAQDEDFIRLPAQGGLETSGWGRAGRVAAEGVSGAVEVGTPLLGARLASKNSRDAVGSVARAGLSY